MQLKSHDPSAIFAPVGPYTHGLEVVEARRLLFITGTMGLDKRRRTALKRNAPWRGATSAPSWKAPAWMQATW